MKKLIFGDQEFITLAILLFSLLLGLIMYSFMFMNLSGEVNTAAKFYNVTQNGTTYTGRIIRGDHYVKVTDKDDNMVILDAAHGPISIRRSDLGNFSID